MKLGVSIPSTITRGSCKPSPSANVPIPRMRNVDWSFPGSPLLCTANKPGMRPTKELLILACGDCTNSFVDIMEIAPVTVVSCRVMENVFFPSNFRVCDTNPTHETIIVLVPSGTFSVNFPL